MFSLEFEQENAAFGETGPECDVETARILRILADKVENGCTDGPISDVNGNRIGVMATT